MKIKAPKLKMPRFPGMESDPLLFALTEESIEHRHRWLGRVRNGTAFGLGVLTVILLFFLAANNIQRIAIVILAAIKYFPTLSVVYSEAKAKAASYLTDIFELEDPALANDFIEDVAFGYGKDVTYGEWAEKITIHDGVISEKDERSHIILIGGPGYVQVNLDSVALLERVDGVPEIIEPRAEPWKLGRFERIREIGKTDTAGKREYAIINLRDQFIRGLSVKSRTKDGIPLEALDIKVMFSIKRKQTSEASANNIYNYDEVAVYNLVYEQSVISPTPVKTAGVTFPWDTSLIPLVSGEIESLITSHTLSEILASISEKELDALNQFEADNQRIRFEMTGEQTVVSGNGEQTTVANKDGQTSPLNFQSRSKLTDGFFKPAFTEKADKLGVAIHWIDIGTWQLPSEVIGDHLKGAWKLQSDNLRKSSEIAHQRQEHEMKELLELVNNVIIGNYSRASNSGSGRKLSEKEYLELMKRVEDTMPNADIGSAFQQRLSSSAAAKRDTNSIALDMLKAFRKEFVAAIDLIGRENRNSIEKQADIARIQKALHDIDHHILEYNKGSH